MLVAGTCRPYAQTTAKSDQLLALAMTKIQEATDRQPKFECDAVISRELYRSNSPDFIDPSDLTKRRTNSLISRDRLHVEVATFNGEQLFSWPGTGTFQFETLSEMTGSGASGTGEFGPFAISFLSDSNRAALRYRGETYLEGKQVAEYAYQVPLATSHYMVKVNRRQSEQVAYVGSIFVSINTGNLRRLLVSVPSPPAVSGIARARVDTVYVPRENGGGPFLFPSSSSLAMVFADGYQGLNRAAYRNCRVFASESRLSFSAPLPEGAKVEEPKTDQARVPPGLRVRSRMITPVGTRSSAAGDLFEARVLGPIKQGKHLIVPTGALLQGRIVAVEENFYPRASACIRLQFYSVHFDNKSLAISLSARAEPSHPTFRPEDGPPSSGKTPSEVDPTGEHVASLCVFDKDHVRIDGHAVNEWETR
jgi:hypothetical protein